jgi:hypothetical protein
MNRRWWRRPGFSSTTQQLHSRVKRIIPCMHCRQRSEHPAPAKPEAHQMMDEPDETLSYVKSNTF